MNEAPKYTYPKKNDFAKNSLCRHRPMSFQKKKSSNCRIHCGYNLLRTYKNVCSQTFSYSSVPNKRPGWNKRIGRGKSYNLINVLDGINVLVG